MQVFQFYITPLYAEAFPFTYNDIEWEDPAVPALNNDIWANPYSLRRESTTFNGC